ncbi:MAG: 6-phosphogluconolactonase [Methylotenera sp.]|nr:MAG: 6-phosphogluconolactonase [Methylotenera sp.]
MTQNTSLNHTRWHTFQSQDAINQDAVKRILAAAEDAINQHGSFLIVLAGGSTPKSVYQLLSQQKADWAKWHVFHNDDRCLPVDHVDRNSKMARDVWLNHVAIPQNQIHDIPTELGNVEGAKAYARTLNGVRAFDLVILGLGEDGHTASLFPNQIVDNSADVVPVFDAPKPPADRVTMSQNRLNKTNEVLFLVTGAGKQEAVNNWRKGVKIPATLIAPENGVDVYCFGVKLN